MTIMKVSKKMAGWSAACGLALAVLLAAGCQTTSSGARAQAGNGSGAAVAAAESASTSTAPADSGTPTTAPSGVAAALSEGFEVLRVGDTLIIDFSDLPTQAPKFEERINDNGNITLIFNQSFQAAGKTRGELQEEIRRRYVPKYYKYLTVTIKPLLQFFFVGGEVRAPNRYEYVGKMTVLKAIKSAGDFTDFANKRAVTVTRAKGGPEGSGQPVIINCRKAIKDPRLDVEVYPGDTIHVPRRTLPW
jgi:polysaccharide export outer membrane protein